MDNCSIPEIFGIIPPHPAYNVRVTLFGNSSGLQHLALEFHWRSLIIQTLRILLCVLSKVLLTFENALIVQFEVNGQQFFHFFLAHLSQRLEWAIVIAHRPSVRPSGVRKLFTFSTSSPEPLDGFWWNLVGMKYSWSLTSVVVFRPDPLRGGSWAGPK